MSYRGQRTLQKRGVVGSQPGSSHPTYLGRLKEVDATQGSHRNFPNRSRYVSGPEPHPEIDSISRRVGRYKTL